MSRRAVADMPDLAVFEQGLHGAVNRDVLTASAFGCLVKTLGAKLLAALLAETLMLCLLCSLSSDRKTRSALSWAPMSSSALGGFQVQRNRPSRQMKSSDLPGWP